MIIIGAPETEHITVALVHAMAIGIQALVVICVFQVGEIMVTIVEQLITITGVQIMARLMETHAHVMVIGINLIIFHTTAVHVTLVGPETIVIVMIAPLKIIVQEMEVVPGQIFVLAVLDSKGVVVANALVIGTRARAVQAVPVIGIRALTVKLVYRVI